MIPPNVIDVSWDAYLPMPKSWSKKKKSAMAGRPHRQKPDRDNIDKAAPGDSLSVDQVIMDFE